MRASKTLGVVALVVLLGLGGSSRAQGGSALLDAEVGARVDALAAEALAKPGGVGLSIGVARKGKVLVAKGYGLADAEAESRADGETVFRIGSVTKQFTAAAILRFVEQEKFTLDETLEVLVPSFPTEGRSVTVRQLLNHTSGIPSYTDTGAAWKAKWPLELSDGEVLGLVRDKPLDFEPGSDFRYNNTGYFLLGIILGKGSGRGYAAHMEETIFRPLGLSRTRYDSNRDLIKNRAQGYRLTPAGITNDEYLGMSQPGGAGGLLSTGGDLVHWQMALTGGKVVKPESFAAMTAPTVLADGKDRGYGFGLMIDTVGGRKRILHGGGIHGFNSMLFWFPTDDLHVAVISNGEALRSDQLADALAAALLGQ